MTERERTNAMENSRCCLFCSWFNLLAIALLSPLSYAKQSQWRAYTDMMTATCVNRRESNLREQRTLLKACLTHQTDYLHCGSFTPEQLPVLVLIGDKINSYRHMWPCGWGEIHHTRPFPKRSFFNILVMIHFHINVTFHHFRLPMAFQTSDSFAFHDHVRFSTELNNAESDHVFFGWRPPFWIKWDHNQLFVKYIGSTGSFQMQYQVCEPYRQSLFVSKLFESPIYRFHNSATTIMTTGLPFWPVSDSLSLYSFHIIGSKMRALDLTIGFYDLYRGVLDVKAYEGPVAFEDYEHSDTRYLLQGQWIYFLTFQGYLQLWCTKQECHKLYVQFAWGFVVETSATLYAPTNKRITFPSRHCQGNQMIRGPSSLLLCSYVLDSPPSQYLHVEIEELHFEGYDFVGNYSSDQTCLLAGLTLVDMARYYLVKTPEHYFKETGQLLEESIIDNIFPEITICHLIPFIDNATYVTYKIPMTKFTTTTSGLLVLIYAYGHHFDLMSSRVSIRVSMTSTIGLLLNCPIVSKDGFLQYNVDSSTSISFRKDYVSLLKQDMCSFSKHILFYFIQYGTSKSIKVIYCYSYFVTYVQIISQLDDHLFENKNLVIQINVNPKLLDTPECEIIEYDVKLRAIHSYVIEVQLSHSMYCAATSLLTPLINVVAFDNSKGIKVHPNRLSSNNSNYVYRKSSFKVNIHIRGQCTQLCITVSSSCQKMKTVASADLSIKTAKQSLSRKEFSSACKSYELPQLLNRTLEFSTYEFYVSHHMAMDILKMAVSYDIQIGRLSAEILNKEVPALYQLGVTLTADHCLDSCKQFDLTIAYEETTTGRLIWLQWDVYMGQSKAINITIMQIPLNDWVIYVTPERHTFPCNDGKNHCQQVIHFRTLSTQAVHRYAHRLIGGRHKDHNLVAHLVFVWTQQPHTWNEAKSICKAQDMHLVSLASEAEYLLVLDLLLGEAPSTPDGADIPILTPCKLETPLCAIYIGVEMKVRNNQPRK